MITPKKKIKLFCAAYVNKTNAQNLSVLALAEHIDQSRFHINSFSIFNGDLPMPKLKGLTVYHIRYPFRLFAPLVYLRAIMASDVLYFPRAENPWFVKLYLKLFRKPSFRTVRNTLDDLALKSAVTQFGKTAASLTKNYGIVDKLYSTTPHMKQYNEERWGLKTEETILFPTSDNHRFVNSNKRVKSLNDLLFIGNDMKRKGAADFLYLAQKFPQLTFHLVGSGWGYDVNKEVERLELRNVEYHGERDQHFIAELLYRVDLHVFPSKSEGLGKVTIETAAAGVPSLLYSHYGARGWINDGEEGLIVDNLEEMENTVRDLVNSPELLQKLSANVSNLADRFHVKTLTEKYEQVIENLYSKRDETNT